MQSSSTFLLALLALTGCAGALAQQPSPQNTSPASSTASAAPTTTPTSAASASSTASTPPATARDVAKRAKNVGFTPETHKGVTLYCKYGETQLGTRFPTKKTCYNEDQIVVMIEQLEQQKNALSHPMGGPQGH